MVSIPIGCGGLPFELLIYAVWIRDPRDPDPNRDLLAAQKLKQSVSAVEYVQINQVLSLMESRFRLC